MREIKDPTGGGWKIREILDPYTSERYNQYFYKNKRAPRIELRTKIAKQLAGYTLIEKDLRNVALWIKEIDKLFPSSERPGGAFISPDRERFNVIKGLYVAALSFYGKCFTQCEGRKVKLDKKFIDDKYHEIHDNIMHMRHNYAAHSGSDTFEEVKIALVLYPNKNTKLLPRVVKELQQADMMYQSADEKLHFIDLVEHTRLRVLNKMEVIEKRILENDILPQGKDHWYKLAKKS